MTTPFWKHVARLPRHSAATKAGIAFQVELSQETGAESTPPPIKAQLLDVSRQGVQVQTDRSLAEEVAVVVCIRQAGSKFDLRLPATVCWQRTEDEQRWTVGCEFAEQLSWEDYGELFLNGILEVD